MRKPSPGWRSLPWFLAAGMYLFAGRVLFRSHLRVDQLGEARVVRHVPEVGVVPGLEAVARIQSDGLGQVLEGVLIVTGQAIQYGQPVPPVIGRSRLFNDLIQVLARPNIVADVHQ